MDLAHSRGLVVAVLEQCEASFYIKSHSESHLKLEINM